MATGGLVKPEIPENEDRYRMPFFAYQTMGPIIMDRRSLQFINYELGNPEGYEEGYETRKILQY
jgi:hypothetical protein